MSWSWLQNLQCALPAQSESRTSLALADADANADRSNATRQQQRLLGPPSEWTRAVPMRADETQRACAGCILVIAISHSSYFVGIMPRSGSGFDFDLGEPFPLANARCERIARLIMMMSAVSLIFNLYTRREGDDMDTSSIMNAICTCKLNKHTGLRLVLMNTQPNNRSKISAER
jgi:hypothetical protein